MPQYGVPPGKHRVENVFTVTRFESSNYKDCHHHVTVNSATVTHTIQCRNYHKKCAEFPKIFIHQLYTRVPELLSRGYLGKLHEWKYMLKLLCRKTLGSGSSRTYLSLQFPRGEHRKTTWERGCIDRNVRKT